MNPHRPNAAARRRADREDAAAAAAYLDHFARPIAEPVAPAAGLDPEPVAEPAAERVHEQDIEAGDTVRIGRSTFVVGRIVTKPTTIVVCEVGQEQGHAVKRGGTIERIARRPVAADPDSPTDAALDAVADRVNAAERSREARKAADAAADRAAFDSLLDAARAEHNRRSTAAPAGGLADDTDRDDYPAAADPDDFDGPCSFGPDDFDAAADAVIADREHSADDHAADAEAYAYGEGF